MNIEDKEALERDEDLDERKDDDELPPLEEPVEKIDSFRRGEESHDPVNSNIFGYNDSSSEDEASARNTNKKQSDVWHYNDLEELD